MANVLKGDKIRIINPLLTCGRYQKGDVFTIQKIDGNGVKVFEHGVWIHEKEFEVIREEAITLESATYEQLLDEMKRRVDSAARYETATTKAKIPKPARGLSRSSIVLRAKADVEAILARGKDVHQHSGEEGHEIYRRNFYSVQFITNPEKRTVVALIRFGPYLDVTKQVIHRGVAKCDPSDCFNEHIGKAIAVRRALGLDVPYVYIDSPQPEGPNQVGDIVVNSGGERRILIKGDGEFVMGVTAHVGSHTGEHGRLVDDTGRY